MKLSLKQKQKTYTSKKELIIIEIHEKNKILFGVY